MEHRDRVLSRVTHATENIIKLELLIQESPPFSYYLETDLLTGKRATFVKCNEAVADKIAFTASDIIHTLRAALDNAYWAIVAPFSQNDSEKRRIQFPFCEKKDDLENELKKRLADRVGQKFCDSLVNLKPFQKDGGDQFLGLVHWMNVEDKHRELIPIAEFKTISSEQMQELIPDFPPGFKNVSLGQNYRDVTWYNPTVIQKVVPPFATRIETRVDVQIEAIFSFSKPPYRGMVIATLNEMVSATRKAIEAIRGAQG